MNVLLVSHIDARPVMGVMLLSAALRRAGHRTAAAHLDESAVRRALARTRFDVIALSYPTCFADRAAALVQRIRRDFGGVILAGGPHPTFRPAAVLAGAPVDAVCVGEGESALPEALAALGAGRPIAGLAGWWARQDGRIVEGPKAPLCTDLDALPLADREILRPHVTFGDRVQAFLFSRGCAFACTYCFEPVFRTTFGGPAIRQRSVESAIDELLLVKRTRDVRMNMIYDDTFNQDRVWLEELLRAYGEKVRIPFACKVRPDLLDAETARALSRAGCRLVFMGIECGDPDLRARVLGRRISDESIVRAARLVRQHSMKLVTYNMAAIPGTGFEDDLKTVDLNLACRPHMTMVMFLQPYAGTPIHDTAVACGQWSGADDERLERAGLGVQDRSPLRFADPRERRRVENLRHLTGLVLAAPILRRALPTLVRLPAGPLYARLCSLWYLRGHFRVVYPGMSSPLRLLRAALRERFPALRPRTTLLRPTDPPPPLPRVEASTEAHGPPS